MLSRNENAIELVKKNRIICSELSRNSNAIKILLNNF